MKLAQLWPRVLRHHVALGHDKWKANPESSDYDYRLVQERLAQLNKVRESADVMAMSYYLRASLTRNLGDCGNYKVSAEVRL